MIRKCVTELISGAASTLCKILTVTSGFWFHMCSVKTPFQALKPRRESLATRTSKPKNTESSSARCEVKSPKTHCWTVESWWRQSSQSRRSSPRFRHRVASYPTRGSRVPELLQGNKFHRFSRKKISRFQIETDKRSAKEEQAEVK